MKKLKRLLLTGLIVVAPFSLTFILISWFVGLVDRVLAAPLFGFLGRPIPGLGLVLAFILILLAGVLGSNIFGRHLLEVFEEFLLKIPVFNSVYRVFKQLSGVFSPGENGASRAVVLIEYPRPGIYSVGFLTNRLALEDADGRRELVSVYVPTNNVYIGNYVLVPASQVVSTDLTSHQALQATMSAGAALPRTIKASPETRRA